MEILKILDDITGVLFLIALPAGLAAITTNWKTSWLMKLANLCMYGAVLLMIAHIVGRFVDAPAPKKFYLSIALVSIVTIAALLNHQTRTFQKEQRERESELERLQNHVDELRRAKQESERIALSEQNVGVTLRRPLQP